MHSKKCPHKKSLYGYIGMQLIRELLPDHMFPGQHKLICLFPQSIQNPIRFSNIVAFFYFGHGRCLKGSELPGLMCSRSKSFPLGLQTLLSSFNPATGSGTEQKTNVANTVSKLLFGNASCYTSIF
jgi:hypothetical protein